MLRIFHTADVHVGLRFTRGYPDGLQQELVEERVRVLERMADIANEQKCELFVVAGDLFDHLRVAKNTIRKVAEALARFEGVVAVLPGNHDYVQDVDDPIWPPFVSALGEGHLFLDKAAPYDLEPFGINAVLFPGPCRSKHSRENALGWIKENSVDSWEAKFRIGIAHGSLSGLSPDFNGDYFPMTEDELMSIGLDVWLLGHTHVRFPDVESGSATRVFYPSTPEPDGFDCRHQGHAWIIDLEAGEEPAFRSVVTGRFQFQDISENNVMAESDLDRIRREFAAYDPDSTLVRLRMHGRLTDDVLQQLPEFQRNLKECARYLELDTRSLLRAVRQSDIDAEFTEDSFPHRLLTRLAENEEDQLALQLAYELISEVSQ